MRTKASVRLVKRRKSLRRRRKSFDMAGCAANAGPQHLASQLCLIDLTSCKRFKTLMN